MWIGTVVLLVAAAGGGLYWRWRAHKAPVLTEKDTIVLADFDNKTGDPVFDDTLKQGLAIQLEQSPFLELISQGKVSQTLKLMDRPADAALTPEVAREVCQRTGSKAMLTGSIASLGSQYVIGLKAVELRDGRRAGGGAGAGGGKESVLKALDAAAIRMRSKLGESLSSVQKYATPLEEATTPSLEALKAYSQGEKMIVRERETTAALPFYKRAVELDPNFASGLRRHGGRLQQPQRSWAGGGECTQGVRAAGEDERTGAVAHRGRLLHVATGELEKAAQVYELWQQTYPRDDCAMHKPGYSFPSPWKLGKGVGGSPRGNPPGAEYWRPTIPISPSLCEPQPAG